MKKYETDKRRKPRLLLDVEVDAYLQKTTAEVIWLNSAIYCSAAKLWNCKCHIAEFVITPASSLLYKQFFIIVKPPVELN